MTLTRLSLSKKTRSRLFLFVRISVSVGLLSYIVTRFGVGTILAGLRDIEITFFALALILSVLGIFLSAAKWGLLLRIKGFEFSNRSLVTYYYIGQFFNAFLPTAIGGDSARMYFLHRDSNTGIDSVSSVVVERLTGLLSICLIGGTAVILGRGLLSRQTTVLIFGIASGVSLILVISFFTDAFTGPLERTLFRIDFLDAGDLLEKTYTSVIAYRQYSAKIGFVLVVSIFVRIISVIINYVVALGIGIDIDPVYFFVFIPVVELLLFVPVSIQGFGVREASYAYLFSLVGGSPTKAVSLAIAVQLLMVLNNILGGLVYVKYSLGTVAWDN